MPAKEPTGDWRWPSHQLTDDQGEEQEEDGQHGDCHPVLGDQNPVLESSVRVKQLQLREGFKKKNHWIRDHDQ